jgi:phytoene dehydrogenase-like protein
MNTYCYTGGSGAVIDALVRGLRKHGGELHLRSPVAEILVEGGRASGVKLRNGSIIRARKAVVTNASVWDTLKLLPAGAWPESEVQQAAATPDTASFMHLHLGIDGADMPAGIGIHYSVINSWEVPIDAPLNMVIGTQQNVYICLLSVLCDRIVAHCKCIVGKCIVCYCSRSPVLPESCTV